MRGRRIWLGQEGNNEYKKIENRSTKKIGFWNVARLDRQDGNFWIHQRLRFHMLK